ncbi:MAG: protein adenylyltransferase SelO [Thiolinea sp.]
MSPQLSIPFDNSYITLPDYFYERLSPQPVSQPALIRLNSSLVNELGLDINQLESTAGIDMFAGNLVPEGAEPLAMVYSGHQFGHFSPQLGDGRAIQLGEVLNPEGIRFDIQLKGSGRTPYSRGGDGRAALGPVLREYVLCEFMHAVGVPTTRALAAVTTGENVVREQLLPGAVITRLATSYVRVGTFQFFAARGKVDALQELADYVIRRNYPELSEHRNPYLALLEAVIGRQAKLIAQWMQLGFIHGVMNTDNMSIAGETIDYGPCAFMDGFRADKVYSSIDHQGRYAYQNQPAIAHWNLCRFAETLIPLLGEDYEASGEQVQAAINTFPALYHEAWLDGMRAKLGLANAQDGDRQLAEDLLSVMEGSEADFTQVFRKLSQLEWKAGPNDTDWLGLFSHAEQADAWLVRWRERLQAEEQSDDQRQAVMKRVNPLYIPRNHLVEAAIRAGEDHGDLSVFHQLVNVLKHPFESQSGLDKYTQPPEPEQIVHRTFCGT